MIVDQNNEVVSYQTPEGYVTTSNNGGTIIADYFYSIPDWLGTNRAIMDANGNVLNANDHYPFGKRMPTRYMVTDAEGNRYQFTGHEYDEEVGYGYHGARYYNRELGRYMNVDPLAKYHETSYAYAANNPIMFIDLNGEDTITISQNTTTHEWKPLPGDRAQLPPSISVESSINIKEAEGRDVFFYNVSNSSYDADGNLTSSSSSSYEFDPSDNSTRQGLFKMDYAYVFSYSLTDQQSLAKLMPSNLIEHYIQKTSGWEQLAYKSIRGYKDSYGLIQGLNTGVQVAYSFYIGGALVNSGLKISRIGSTSRIINNAKSGTGNFGSEVATWNEAQTAGKAWVGEGHRLASDGKTLISADGLRAFRPPSWKPKLKMNQANFEMRSIPKGPYNSNYHLNIHKP